MEGDHKHKIMDRRHLCQNTIQCLKWFLQLVVALYKTSLFLPAFLPATTDVALVNLGDSDN